MKRRSLFVGLAALGVIFGTISTAGAVSPGLIAGPTNLMDIAKKNDAGIILSDFRGTRATGDAGSSGAPITLSDGIVLVSDPGSNSYQLAATPPAKKTGDKKPRMTATQKREAAAKAKAEQEAKAKAAAAAAAKMKANADRRAKCDADAGCRFGRMMRCRVLTGGEGGISEDSICS